MTLLPEDRRTASVLAALVGDSLALGAHWEYDAKRLAEVFGRVDTLRAPAPGSHHAGKRAGEFTHYGDQALVLLKSLVDTGGFSAQNFADRWQAFFGDYSGYLDNATKTTLRMFEFGLNENPAGSNSDDLAGASRLAPLLALPWTGEDDLVAAARAQTRVTHNNAFVLDAAEFLARTAVRAAQGRDALQAMREAAAVTYQSAPMAKWVEAGMASAQRPSVEAIGAFGQSCHVDSALPAVVHLVARHPADLETCLVECVMAGGDSAARGMAAGMILGAALGMGAIPQPWLDGLQRREEIAALLQALA